MRSRRLFVYGTLIDEERLRTLTGRRFPRHVARLAGWKRITTRAGYPGIVPAAGAHVDGLVIDGLDATALAALDAYEDEGRLYLRHPVAVTSGGRRLACEAYVARTGPPGRARRRRRASRA